MNISEEGVRLVCSFEGYHKALTNGDCTAYQTNLGGGKLDIPTIGYGCTVGVSMGMVWTRQQAEDAMRAELAKHEAYVTQYVTVPLNQNEFDALVSFSYNVGPGNLKTLVARLNRGDRAGTAKAFLLYVKAQGRTLPGLVARRTRESALFQKPVVAPVEPAMPQTVQKAIQAPSAKVTAAAAVTATVSASQAVPSVSDVDKIVQTGQHVRSLTDQIGDLSTWMWHSPVAPLAFAAMAAGLIYVFLEGGIGTSSKGASSDSSN